MRLRPIPGRTLLGAIAAGAAGVLAARLFGLSAAQSSGIAAAWGSMVLVLAALDYALTRRGWRRAAPRLLRRLPAALAIGVRRPVHLAIELQGEKRWRCGLYDHADPSVLTEGLPVHLDLHGGQRAEVMYAVVPSRRGEVLFAPADVRVRSRLGFWELLDRVGADDSRRVYPDFAQVARYAWLAGDRRLSEIGIKTYQQRGEGTDFKELSEYRIGDAVRHIDWKATLRSEKPIVRQFQNERDQCVMLLIDCGRRLRSDDRRDAFGSAHFDQVLNAVMLLSYVALKQGDAVGAMTFGTPPGDERYFPPRKGAATLNALMAELYSVQPSPTHSDYVLAAKDLLRKQAKRSLVIVITNFRDEDASELGYALRLLRSRHLVLLASLRERIVHEIASRPVTSGNAAIDIASAHLYAQARRDAFNRLAAKDALMVDAEPEKLGIELVNRYHAAKRAGML